ncbi:MAG: hypothetical protein ACRDMV_00240 [Streptosporangiales bacterium]
MASGTVMPSALTSVGNVAEGFEDVPNKAVSGLDGGVASAAAAHAGSTRSSRMLDTVDACWTANFHNHAMALWTVGYNLVSTASHYANTDEANENEFDPVQHQLGHTGLIRPI